MVSIKEKAGDVIEVSIIWDPRHKNHVGRYYPKPIPWEGITSRGITCLQNKHGRQIELAHQGPGKIVMLDEGCSIRDTLPDTGSREVTK